MGKYITWEAFRDTAIDVLQNNPYTSRLVVKYNDSKGVCILKVTDDQRWIMTKITNIKDFTKIEQFVNASCKLLSNQFEESSFAMEEEKQAQTGAVETKKLKQTSEQGKANKKKSKKI